MDSHGNGTATAKYSNSQGGVRGLTLPWADELAPLGQAAGHRTSGGMNWCNSGDGEKNSRTFIMTMEFRLLPRSV